MREAKYLKTTKVMIFPSDDIYLAGLNSEAAIQKITSTFSLVRAPLSPQFLNQIPQLVFQNGVFEYNGNTYIIDQISIDDRKIIINILSPSSVSDLFFNEFRKLLVSIDQREEKSSYDPLISTYETTCILKLDIKLDRLIGIIRAKEIEELISTKHSHGASISLIPTSVRFQISYNDIPEKYIKNKISISDKPFLIELREKTNPDDQIYYTVSPTDSDTHLEILKALEKMFE